MENPELDKEKSEVRKKIILGVIGALCLSAVLFILVYSASQLMSFGTKNPNNVTRSYVQRSASEKKINLQKRYYNYTQWTSCGKSKSSSAETPTEPSLSARIAQGEVANKDDYPWMSQFGLRRDNGKFQVNCGAVLIMDQWALTAAQCCDEKLWKKSNGQKIKKLLAVGAYDEKAKGKQTSVEKCIIHPEYNGITKGKINHNNWSQIHLLNECCILRSRRRR